MTINEAVAQFIATLNFWHIIILIVVVVICLIAYVRIANVKSWSFRNGFQYYPDHETRRVAKTTRRALKAANRRTK
jgi:TM2 domain-containing membrane protein YozV